MPTALRSNVWSTSSLGKGAKHLVMVKQEGAENQAQLQSELEDLMWSGQRACVWWTCSANTPDLADRKLRQSSKGEVTTKLAKRHKGTRSHRTMLLHIVSKFLTYVYTVVWQPIHRSHRPRPCLPASQRSARHLGGSLHAWPLVAAKAHLVDPEDIERKLEELAQQQAHFQKLLQRSKSMTPSPQQGSAAKALSVTPVKAKRGPRETTSEAEPSPASQAPYCERLRFSKLPLCST